MTIEVMLKESDTQRHAESESSNVESTQREHADGIVTGEERISSLKWHLQFVNLGSNEDRRTASTCV